MESAQIQSKNQQKQIEGQTKAESGKVIEI
jgi:hypothetical protein